MSGDPIEALHAVPGGGYLVEVGGFDASPGRVRIVDGRSSRELVRGALSGLVVDAGARRAAWTQIYPRTETGRTALAIVNLPSGDRVARQVVDGLWDVVGFAGDRLVLTSVTSPDGPPSVWDPATGEVTELPLPEGSPSGHPVALQADTGLLLFGGQGEGCPTAVLVSRPEPPQWEHCGASIWSAAFSPDAELIAVIERKSRGSDTASVRDAVNGETVHRWETPRGAELYDVAWEDVFHVLVILGYEDVDVSESVLIRCRVGGATCERVPTPDNAYITALGGS